MGTGAGHGEVAQEVAALDERTAISAAISVLHAFNGAQITNRLALRQHALDKKFQGIIAPQTFGRRD